MEKNLGNFREGPFRRVIVNDELVFNGPGIDIPTISISRFPYPEYHTSDDNPDIILKKNLEESKGLILRIIDIMDKDYVPKRKFKGPVFLSGCGLWVDPKVNARLNANLDFIMNSFEGNKSIFDIADELNMEFYDTLIHAENFFKKSLIEKHKI